MFMFFIVFLFHMCTYLYIVYVCSTFHHVHKITFGTFFCFPTQYTKLQHASVFQLAMLIGCED